MHKWTVQENITCILCYKHYKNLPINKQKDILQSLLPCDISRSSISMKLANIKYLDIHRGFRGYSKVLKQQWNLLK